MSLRLPEGKKVAVSISADFDAHAAWKGGFDRTSPSYLSRGEFGAEVGVPRLLEEFGFEWDSSLMGREFDPYHPRPVHANWTEGNTFGEPSPILEIPVSWYLDDWPAMEYVAGVSQGLGDHEVLFRRWRDIFDYARSRDVPGVYALTLHPQCSGRSFLIAMLERLIQHMSTHGDAWFCTLSDIYDAWTDD